jgi:hypothetical protein
LRSGFVLKNIRETKMKANLKRGTLRAVSFTILFTGLTATAHAGTGMGGDEALVAVLIVALLAVVIGILYGYDLIRFLIRKSRYKETSEIGNKINVENQNGQSPPLIH